MDPFAVVRPSDRPTVEAVTLRGGPTVRVEALRLGWELEARGFALSVYASGGVSVEPFGRLTMSDRKRLSRDGAELGRAVGYRAG